MLFLSGTGPRDRVDSWPRKSSGSPPLLHTNVCLRSDFDGKLRDECLNGEIFYTVKEAQAVIEQWRAVQYSATAFFAGIQATAPKAIMAKQRGHGDTEDAARFPHLHTPTTTTQ
jgi:hypothetical protein